MVERKSSVISSAVEKSNYKARSIPFCPSLRLRDFSASLVAANCALSKPRTTRLETSLRCRFSSRKYYSFARVRVVERKSPVISSAVEKSDYMARSTERLHLIIAGGLRGAQISALIFNDAKGSFKAAFFAPNDCHLRGKRV